jgi:protein archease
VTWETFEHQADVGFLVHGASGPELFAEAGYALLSLLYDLERVENCARYELAGEAANVEELLVDWLNGLLYLFEGERIVFRSIRFPVWSETHYRADLRGEPADARRHGLRGLVKAATYHGLEVTSDGSGWRARVILDV